MLERFAAAGIAAEQVSFARETWTFSHPGSPGELLALFRDYYGPTMNAYAAAESDGRAESLQAELEELFATQNTASDGSTSIPATYLRVEVSVP